MGKNEKLVFNEAHMKQAETRCREDISLSERLMSDTGWFSTGAFLSGITVLLFLFWHNPNFFHPQNILERNIEENYHWAILSEVFIVLFSGAYTIFLTMRLRLGLVGDFPLTLFFLGFSIPLMMTQLWYYMITQQSSHIDKVFVFVSFGISFDGIFLMLGKENDLDNTIAYIQSFIFLIVLLLTLPMVLGHDVHRVESHLEWLYKEAKSLPKTPSHSTNQLDAHASKTKLHLQ